MIVVIYESAVAGKNEMQKSIAKVLRSELEIIERMYGKVTATWADKPEWVASVFEERHDYYGTILTSDTPFRWLEEGTRKRYAVMSNPYVKKSRPGVIGSRQGAGYVAARGKGHIHENWARSHAIKPHGWGDVIAEKREKNLSKKLGTAFATAAGKHLGTRKFRYEYQL